MQDSVNLSARNTGQRRKIPPKLRKCSYCCYRMISYTTIMENISRNSKYSNKTSRRTKCNSKRLKLTNNKKYCGMILNSVISYNSCLMLTSFQEVSPVAQL